MMDLINTPYYTEMLHKGRMIPFFKNDKMVCFITFFIGGKNDKDKYIRDNMWDVLEDNPDGDTVFIDQLLTSKASDNPKLSYEIWHRFKIYIKDNFRNVQIIQWNRIKNGIVKTYKKEM